MARSVHRDSAAVPLVIVDDADKLEARLINAAVVVLGEEMAEAIDNGRLIGGAVALTEISCKVEVGGKSRRVTLSLSMADE